MKAIFLDRDGTVNIDKNYVYKIEDFELIPKTIEALKNFQNKGYLIFIITNQSGIGRGYYKDDDFHKLNNHMLKVFSDNNIKITKTYYCPHVAKDNCECRKPNTKFITDAAKEFKIKVKESFMIGDKTADIKMGENAGLKTVLVMTGKSGKDGEFNATPTFTSKDLYEASLIV